MFLTACMCEVAVYVVFNDSIRLRIDCKEFKIDYRSGHLEGINYVSFVVPSDLNTSHTVI